MDIEWRNQVTYIGVKMDQKLTWGSHIEYTRQKARATRAKLFSMAGHRSWYFGTKWRSSSRFSNRTWITPRSRGGTRPNCTWRNSKLRKTVVDAPWYVRNVDIQRDLKFNTATKRIKQSAYFKKRKAAKSNELRPGARSTPQTTPIPVIE